MQIFVNTPFNEALRHTLRQAFPAGHQLLFKVELPEDEHRDAFRRADVILGNPPAAWFTEAPAQLKFWQLESAGFDGYKHLHLPNVTICNLADYFSVPCAETIVAGILAFYRGLEELTLLKTEKRWVGSPIRYRLGLLTGKRVVILGAGSIGQTVKKMLSGFDCRLQMVARSHPDATIHTPEALLAILPQTDLIINCLPGAAKGFFTADMINAMPPNAVFANIGRGATVDEPALIKALQEERLAGAVLDVTEVEPLPSSHPFWGMSNVILTQHTGGGQANEQEGKVVIFADNFRRFTEGQPPHNQINLQKGY